MLLFVPASFLVPYFLGLALPNKKAFVITVQRKQTVGLCSLVLGHMSAGDDNVAS